MSLSAIATTFVPTYDSEVDVLGLGAPPPPPAFAPAGNLGLARTGSHVEQSVYDDDDLFTVEVEDDAEGVNEMVAGEGLTSPVLNYDEDGNIDWASELLLLSHEPLRRDMLEMLRALNTKYFGELPEGWRVRAFFRFFTGWCQLVSQQHAIEVGAWAAGSACPVRP